MKSMTLRASADIAADPFDERVPASLRASWQLLGGRFEFITASAKLMRLARWAYAGLPRHRLSASAPRLTVRLVLGGRGRDGVAEPAPFAMLSGPGLLCGASPSSSMAVVSAEQRAALVLVARDLLRFPYHVRYELIELAVFTLAARAQGLMPLHAACVGRGRRGLLLTGASGAGKSTAALHCALDGLELVSEDSLFVSPDSLLATGIPNFLHIRRESLRFLAAADAALIGGSPVIRRRSGVEKLEVDLRQSRFRLAQQPVEICGFVELSAREAGRRRLLEPLAPRESRARLLESQPYAAGQPGWRAFARRIASVPAFQLSRSRHPQETVQALRGLLDARAAWRRGA